ncbi:RNA polymerase sigma factor [Inquilinus sp.]|jgi:RNA polymerase sigma factor (sigma-70 family)|uniref:RNA polymerase sigma factor n=1 Tax=Inquilinus sp. TaxID=1932117 RepID=UPI003784BF21
MIDRDGVVPDGMGAAAPDIWDSWISNTTILRRRAIRLTNGNIDEAEEILSSTIIKTVSHVRRYQTIIREPRAFFLFALNNEFISHCRRRRNERQIHDFHVDVYADHFDPPAHDGPDPEQQLPLQQTLKAVFAAVEGLSPSYRILFRMRFCEERSYKDIAESLNISQPLARKRVQFLRERLRDAAAEAHRNAPRKNGSHRAGLDVSRGTKASTARTAGQDHG